MNELTKRFRLVRGLEVAVLALLVALAGCGDDGAAPPRPGRAIVSLTVPSETGAALITLRGPGVADVQGTSATVQMSWRLASSNELRVLVAGALPSGPLLSVSVPDLGRLDEYTGTVVEVADREGRLRSSTAGYDVAFEDIAGTD